jgi:uncharacterized protein YbjT (DUF2867 family)
MILITGAVGNVCRVLVRRLAESGERLRVLVRKPEKYAAPSAAVEVAAGHFGAGESLAPALAGVDRMFLLSAVHPQMVELQGRAVQAAREAGVRHVVKLSGMDADPEAPLALGRWHGEVERRIEASGMAWTHLRPNIFMQNLLPQAAAVVREGVLRSAIGDGRVSVVDVRDIAEVAAAALTDPRHRGRAYTLTGPNAIGQAEMAQAIARVASAPVRFEPQTAAQARESMLAARMPDWWADLLLELFAAAARGECSRVSGDIAAVLGRPPTDFEQFVRDHRSAFVPA